MSNVAGLADAVDVLADLWRGLGEHAGEHGHGGGHQLGDVGLAVLHVGVRAAEGVALQELHHIVDGRVVRDDGADGGEAAGALLTGPVAELEEQEGEEEVW